MAGKRRVLNLGRERSRKQERHYEAVVGKLGMYPLDAPGMPLPGPDFLRVAQALGDGSSVTKKTKKTPASFKAGEALVDLYRRALREPGFTLAVETRPGRYMDATFVTGHLWGEFYAEWEQSLVDEKVSPRAVTGPQPADVMVVSKMPWQEEIQERRNFIAETGKVLISLCARLHLKGLNKWYVTNLVKFMPPDGNKTLKAAWLKDCLPLLHQELRLVRPKYILCLGSDSSQALLGEKCTVTSMQSRVVPLTFPVHLPGEEPQTHTAQCMTVLHPLNVAHAQGPHEERQLEKGLARFGQLLAGVDFTQEKDIDHRVCTSLEEARDWVREMHAEVRGIKPRYRILAIDAEWEGQHSVNKNAWLCTVQVSWADKKSICFHLRDEDKKIVFRDANGRPALRRLARLLTRHLNRYRIAGHFFVSDLEMLCGEGYDLRPGYAVPAEDADDGTPAWLRCMNGEGGLDTAMMAHAVEETGMLGLESLVNRHTPCPAYWVALEDAVIQLCKTLNIKRAALEGYGKVRRDVLIPYANYDADATRRIALALIKLLDSDYQGNNCWEAFWGSMIIQPVILEIHQNGIHVDRRRLDDSTVKFIAARAAKECEIKKTALWPDPPEHTPKAWPRFNVRSINHVKEYLFGERLNGKVSLDGLPVRIRPPGARSLAVRPLLDTGKPPRRWDDIEAAGKELDHNPSTGKAVLAILAQENLGVADEINQIRDYRLLDQVLKSMLRPPKTDEETGEWLSEPEEGDLEAQGLYVYEAGLASCIDDDGMVRTHIYPTAETGRWKSARPNLQNISKTRDPDYARLLRDPDDPGKTLYTHKLRSIFRAPPLGTPVPVVKWQGGVKVNVVEDDQEWVLIESDLRGAELAGMAINAQSPRMIDHAQRSMDWPDEGYDKTGKKKCRCGPGGSVDKKCKTHKYPHENFYDIHSNVAVMAFKLSCHPSKAGLAEAGKSHLRNIAKTVIFGIAYGRGAKAIALAAREQRKPGEPEVSVEDAQAVIDAVFALYPELGPYFEEARRRALDERWLCNCFGRLRRFPETNDYKLEGEFERQAMNYSIQSMIADFVDRWLSTLHVARERLLPTFGEYLFYWQLQIHDALLVRCKPRFVEYIARQLIPWSLERIPVYPSGLDGSPLPECGPYFLGADVEISQHWGERLTTADCSRLGIPTEFGKA